MRIRERWVATACLICTLAFIASGCGTTSKASGETSESRAERVWPLPPDKPRIRFVKELTVPDDVGIKGSLLGRAWDMLAGRRQSYLELPQQIYIGPSARLLVTDRLNKSIQIFDLQNRRYAELKDFKRQPFYSLGGVAEGQDGSLYVTDTITRKVMVFDSKNNPMLEFGGPDVFLRPTSMVFIGQNDRLYVVDTMAHEIKVFDRTGKYLFQFGQRGEGDGEFNFPTYIAADRSANIYVTDTLNHRIEIFDADGNFLSSFGKPGDTYGSFSKPKGIAVDSKGHIYVVDSLHDVVQIFDDKGTLLLSFCESGSLPGQLWLPSGISIDREDRIYVADTFNKRIQIFELLPEKEESK